MLGIGMIGTYTLARELLRPVENKWIRSASSAVTALFYVLHFSTIQMMYIPLEAFSAHIAFLPWILSTGIRYLRITNRKSLLTFFLMSLFSSLQGFIPPLFIVSTILLGGYALTSLDTNYFWRSIKKIIVLLSVFIAANAYWLLPITYYSINNADTYLNSYNNIMTTDEFIQKNKKFGTLENLVYNRGFIMNQ
jgi:hypothetical protein